MKNHNIKDVVFKKATDSNMEEITKLEVDVFEGEQEIPAELIPVPPENSPQWWCALLDGTVIGAIAAWEGNDQIHLGRFAIAPKYRRLHIGTNLVTYSIEDLFSQGIEEIHMEAREVTVKIICAMGAKITGEPMEFYQGTVMPMVLYKKDYFN